MTPISFKEANKDLIKPESMTDRECMTLPVQSNHYLYLGGERNLRCVLVCPQDNHNVIVCVNQTIKTAPD